MVFTGDWNGGERTFRLELLTVARVDPESGAELPPAEGDLSGVDRYRCVAAAVGAAALPPAAAVRRLVDE